MLRDWSCLFVLAVFAINRFTFCEPLPTQNTTDEDQYVPGFDVEYSRYLQEVSSVLQDDDGFQKDADTSDSNHIDQRFKQTSELTRSRLDELKRMELRRLKDLHKQSIRMAAQQQRQDVKLGKPVSRKDLPKFDDSHVDVKNPHSFGSEDIKKLIKKVTEAVADVGVKRRENFKQHELNKAHMFKTKFRDLPEEEQKRKLHEQLEKAKQHEKINHPGNLKQMKEVWSKQDLLDGDNFDPKTFFMLRDVDGDGLLSPSEIEAMFEVELNKLYSKTGADPVLRDEDMNRMREHIFTEVDLDGDGMVNWSEFLKSTNNPEFTEDGSWESVQDTQQFTDEELRKFEEAIKAAEIHSQPQGS